MRSFLLLSACLLAPAVAAQGAPAAPTPIPVSNTSARGLRLYHSALRSYYNRQYAAAAEELTAALRHDPEAALYHWVRSRVLSRGGDPEGARAAAARAEELAAAVDDREQRLVNAWAKWLKAEAAPEADRGRLRDEARRDLDTAIALYPDDPEIWILRAEVAETPLRATPYYLAALHLDPAHPLAGTWKPTSPPLPDLKSVEGAAVGPVQEPPPLMEGLGVLSFPITATKSEARAFFEQGMRTFHSYVLPFSVRHSASRCFQHAAALDPTCAMAYWGLSFCPGSGQKSLDLANRALHLATASGTDRERRYCAARVLELSGREKRGQFLDALDGAIAAYPDDVELWIWRGKSYGNYGGAVNNVAAMPFAIAAHHLQPQHPAPNHELVHLYELIDRPSLGWPYTIGYRRSAFNMPHANHMQAHLAMRLGRWQEAIDCTRMSRRKSLEGYPELDASHHIDVLIRALAHEGRFKEAEDEPRAYRDGLPWARLLRLKGDLPALAAWAEKRRQTNAPDGFYVGALAALERGDLPAAAPLLANVEEQFKKSSAPANMYRHHEVKGLHLVLTGDAEGGLKLLREAAAKAVKDAGLHAWGGGSYMLEAWGEAALRAQRWDEAEEAFHEALAHEHGSIIGALGMQVVWEHRARPEMAGHYAARAAAIWKDADPGARDRQLERLRKLTAASVAARPNTTAGAAVQ